MSSRDTRSTPTDLQSTGEIFERLTQAHLPAILESIERSLQTYLDTDSTLAVMLRYHLKTGGKRLRAILPLAVAETLSADPKSVLAFGAACELLHNATLVHDDLQDGDEFRRGQPTVWVEFGAPQAINLGDAMLYLTLLILDDLPAPVAVRDSLKSRVMRQTLRVIDGQEREFQLKRLERPTLEDYFRMASGKTSGLFALPIVGAAQLCGAPKELLAALGVASAHLGIVFQIQDDILDLYGQKGRDQVGSDIGEGKISSLVAFAFQCATPEQQRWLNEVLRRERQAVSEEDIHKAKDLFVGCGALKKAFDELDRRTQAVQILSALQDAPRLYALLSGLSQFFVQPIAQARALVKSSEM